MKLLQVQVCVPRRAPCGSQWHTTGCLDGVVAGSHPIHKLQDLQRYKEGAPLQAQTAILTMLLSLFLPWTLVAFGDRGYQKGTTWSGRSRGHAVCRPDDRCRRPGPSPQTGRVLRDAAACHAFGHAGEPVATSHGGEVLSWQASLVQVFQAGPGDINDITCRSAAQKMQPPQHHYSSATANAPKRSLGEKWAFAPWRMIKSSEEGQ